MTAEAGRPVPVWATNRGIQVMVRVALAQERRTALPVSGLADFRRALEEARPRAVVVADEDLLAAGLDGATLERLVGDPNRVVLLSAARPLPDAPGPRTRVVAVPFTAADLRDALALAPEAAGPSGQPPSQPPPSPAPAVPAEALAALVRAEVERVVAQAARTAVEDLARRVVPELAEALIRAELSRLLKEAEEAALSDRAAPDEER